MKELHPHLTGLEAVAFAIKLTPHWSGHRDVRPDPGVGNAELYCLSYDRKKTKKNKHLQSPTPYRRTISAGGISELQESCILKIKNPTLLIE